MKTIVSFVLALCATASATAQLVPGTELPRALKDIKPSSSICRRDEGVQPGSDSASAVPEPTPDLSCAIAPPELAAMRDRPDTVLIDTRPRSEHNSFRIGGALGMTVSELHTKSMLRGKNLVLIGDGKAERELYAACTDLKARGFRQVKVLRGGMPSWLVHGGAVEGRGPDVMQALRLDSAQLWGESQFDANLVLVAPDRQAIRSRLPFSMPVPGTSAAAVKGVIERRRKEVKGAPLASVVLVTSGATTDDVLKQMVSALQPVPVLLYTESPDTYTRQFAQLKATWDAQARGPKQLPCGR
jgi:rhodanese-related sulfurtransferase